MGLSTIPQGGPPPKKADHSALSLLLLSALLFVYGLVPEECVKLLSEVGADLNRKDNSGGLTALHMVAGYVKPGVVKLLEDIMEAGEEQQIARQVQSESKWKQLGGLAISTRKRQRQEVNKMIPCMDCQVTSSRTRKLIL